MSELFKAAFDVAVEAGTNRKPYDLNENLRVIIEDPGTDRVTAFYEAATANMVSLHNFREGVTEVDTEDDGLSFMMRLYKEDRSAYVYATTEDDDVRHPIRSLFIKAHIVGFEARIEPGGEWSPWTGSPEDLVGIIEQVCNRPELYKQINKIVADREAAPVPLPEN